MQLTNFLAADANVLVNIQEEQMHLIMADAVL
jgi:hypothetical protein